MKGKTRVLVVDDEDSLRMLTNKHLEKRGYETRVARDGTEAICEIYKFSPHTVVLDINMPGLVGNELISTIKAFRPHIQIIMATAHQGKKIERECMSMGVYAFFSKPVDYDLLDERIKEAVTDMKQPPATRPRAAEADMTEIELTLKLLEKKGLMTREEVLAEIKNIRDGG